MIDTARAIQIAVARADLAISQARASPWRFLPAALIVGGVLWWIIHKRGSKQ